MHEQRPKSKGEPKMKKLLLIALLLGLLTFAFAACSGNDDDDDIVVENGVVDPGPGDDNNLGGEPNQPDPTPATATRASIIAGLADWPAPSGELVIATGTRIDQNILSSSWSNIQPLAHARVLMFEGLSTMSRNEFNEFFPNPMVMRDAAWPVITDNPDGSRTYRFTVYTENRFSDGSPITAASYAGAIALSVSPQWATVVVSAIDWHELAYRGPFSTGEIDVLPSVRLYNDSEFSLTIDGEYIPNVWEPSSYMNVLPFPMHMYGVEIHDNGDGVFLTTMGRDYFCGDTLFDVVEGGAAGGYLVARVEDGVNIYATDTDGNRIPVLDGIRYRPTVFSGPYMYYRSDVGNGVLELVVNPYFPGTWDGYLPRIERLIWRLVPSDQW